MLVFVIDTPSSSLALLIYYLDFIANNGTWRRLEARRGASIKYWDPTPSSPLNPFSVMHQIENLIPLISCNTRIVAFSACSNILGSVVPVKEITRVVRREAAAKGAKKVQISVDCVAYAPHRRMDVQDWDIDIGTISFYKVKMPPPFESRKDYSYFYDSDIWSTCCCPLRSVIYPSVFFARARTGVRVNG